MSAGYQTAPRPLPKPGAPPYTDRWSQEALLTPEVIATPRGIAFPDEVPLDRDRWGVLWAGRALKRGQGKPVYGTAHPQRQRSVMRRLRCHVCNGSADRDGRGVLWVVEDRRGDWEDWPEGLATVHPPLCPRCVPRAVGECHHLARTPWVALRARSPQIVGVHGTVYRLTRGELIPVGEETVRYDDLPALRWVLASQAVAALHDCTLLDPAELTDPTRKG
ncbi:hypothetical protein IQ279_16315 [Streptomyces verrucosisporus]|uniref:hypothetical protein n=1 Tax=Streptomyces verrucosisporus TaxID=1695161 RepID=UPI0019D0F50B|nr:hypothetical protein [Streptomyces verrucosisporus]MBN3931176.1 hypothetical protein [Streptomyces verrucosisporus]